VDLLATLTGGVDPLFQAVGTVGLASVGDSSPGDPAADRALAARLALVQANPTIVVQAAESLSEDDRDRVDLAAKSLRECVPELEAELPKQGVTLELEFVEGKLGKPRASGRRVAAAALARFEGCANDRLLGLRLRDAAEPVTVTLVVTAAGSQ
jgi:hypothetical protein